MINIEIKPLSVNEAYTGRRYKTDKYRRYKRALLNMLPKITLPEPPYMVLFEFGFSSSSSDWDNCIKQFQDTLQAKYKFNDKSIKTGVVNTELVPKGSEYIRFKIISINSNEYRNIIKLFTYI